MNRAFFDEMHKIADDAQAIQEVREHPAVTIAKGVGGAALGAGAGYIGMHGVDKAIKALGGSGVPRPVIRYGAPIAGGAAGLGFGLLQHRMMERMKHNINQPEEGESDGIPEGSPA